MAGTIYIRQSSFADGDTITAALFNNEFNQLANAFAYTTSGTTGHTHDGTDGQGGNISKIGDQDFKNKIVVDTSNNRWGVFVEVGGVTTEQVRIQDGAFVPVVDSDVDLGSPTEYFKDSYIDTVTTTGAVTVGGALSAASFSIGGTALTATITELNTLDGITSTVTELNYTDGVTSNIQTQLNAKQPLDAQLTDIASLTPTDGTFIVGDGTNFVAEAPATALASLGVTSTATELNVLDGITATTTELNYVHNVTSPIQTQLNAKQALNAKLTDISNLTLADNFFLVSTGSNLALESPAAALTSLGVTATAAELNYVDGVTSNVQTQLDTKAPLSSPTFTGTLTAPIINASSDLKIGGTTIAATATELNYLSGVTSSVQTQLDALQASDTDLSAIAALTPSDGTFIVGNGTSWVAESGNTVIASLGVTATATELNYTDGVTSNIQTQLDTKAPLASPTFTGTVTADGLSLGDNEKAQFGNSNDLQIYHDGSNSYVQDAGSGNLYLRQNGTAVIIDDGTNNLAAFNSVSGESSLYYGGSGKKLATTSTGIDVTGTVIADGLTVNTTDVTIDFTKTNAGSFKLNLSSKNYTSISLLADSDGTPQDWLLSAMPQGPFRIWDQTNLAERFQVANNGDISFYEDTGTTPKFFWDASAESLGIGTTSPAAKLEVNAGSTGTDVNTIRMDSDSGGAYNILCSDASSATPTWKHSTGINEDVQFIIGGNDVLYLDSSGNLGIGTTSPNISGFTGYTVASIQGSNGAVLELADSTYVNAIWSADDNLTLDADRTNAGADSYMRFRVDTAEAMRIDSSGNVGIGTTSPDSKFSVVAGAEGEVAEFTGAVEGRGLHISATTDVSASDTVEFNAVGAGTGQFEFYTDGVSRYNISRSGPHVWKDETGSEAMRIDGSNNVGIGTSSPSQRLHVLGSTVNGFIQVGGANDPSVVHTLYGDVSGICLIQCDENAVAPSANRSFRVKVGGAEAMRIDSSGNLLVGKTTNDVTTAGVNLNNNGYISSCVSGNPTAYFNRATNDGNIAIFLKDGTTVGSIGIESNGFYIDGESAHAGIKFTGNAVIPRDNGVDVDGLNDIGASAGRFNDIYATNATIQTSDRNEKQDIEELSDAEQRVAVACKGLLRKFRWKSAVEEKGEDARIHFGIIAQDLQAAFEAEGLDAGRYAMFIHSTWTDEETGEERSRMGVRYSELLAFIIAAL